MATLNATIASVRAIAILDDDADTSWIGEYTDSPDDWNIHCPSGEFVREHIENGLREEIPAAKQELLRRWSDEIADGAIAEFWSDEESVSEEMVLVTITHADGSTEEGYQTIEFRPEEYRNEYTYFAPYAGGEPAGTDDYRKYAMQDYKRMESLNSGDWNFIGIRCVATIDVNGEDLEIESPGLWGVESDSDRECIAEIIDHELSGLRAQLLEFGFSEDEIQFPSPSELAERLDA